MALHAFIFIQYLFLIFQFFIFHFSVFSFVLSFKMFKTCNKPLWPSINHFSLIPLFTRKRKKKRKAGNDKIYGDKFSIIGHKKWFNTFRKYIFLIISNRIVIQFNAKDLWVGANKKETKV
jgi:hypothetical protein